MKKLSWNMETSNSFTILRLALRPEVGDFYWKYTFQASKVYIYILICC